MRMVREQVPWLVSVGMGVAGVIFYAEEPALVGVTDSCSGEPVVVEERRNIPPEVSLVRKRREHTSEWVFTGDLSGNAATATAADDSGNFSASTVTHAAGTGAIYTASSGGNTVTVVAPSTVSSSYTLTLPDSAGSSGNVLTTDGTGTTSWSTVFLPANRVYATTNATVTVSGANQIVVFGSAAINTGGYSPSTGRYTVPTTGIYLVIVTVAATIPALATLTLQFGIGTTPISGYVSILNNIAGTTSMVLAGLVSLTAAQQFTILATPTGLTNPTIASGSGALTIQQVG